MKIKKFTKEEANKCIDMLPIAMIGLENLEKSQEDVRLFAEFVVASYEMRFGKIEGKFGL